MNHQLNKNWQTVKLHEICITRIGVLTSKHYCTSFAGRIPYIKAIDINCNTIVHATEKISEDIIRQAGIEIAEKDSVLIAVSGSNAGNVALLGKDAVVNQNVFCATIKTKLIKPKFLYYFLLFKKQEIVKVTKYASRVSYRYLQKLNVPLPSLHQQQGIIKYLDTHLEQLNISISHIKDAISKIEHHKQQLLNKVFSYKQADDSFTECNILKLKDCGTIQAGKTPNGSLKKYYGSDYPLFKPSDLRQEMHVKHAETYLSAKGLKEARYVRANSLLICSRGVNFGKVGITKVDGACSQQMFSFVPNEKLIPEFIYFQMNSNSFRHQLLKHSTNLMVKKSEFINLSLLVTNLHGQQSILDKLSVDIKLLVKKESNYHKKLRSLDNAKKDLLLSSFTSCS
jgi:restriction endonuclease S subunit